MQQMDTVFFTSYSCAKFCGSFMTLLCPFGLKCPFLKLLMLTFLASRAASALPAGGAVTFDSAMIRVSYHATFEALSTI